MIRLDDYEESEDLTADMVRAWLRAKGWERYPALDNMREECWRRDDGSRGTVWLGGKTPKQLACTIESLRVWTGLSLQSLLREINPRMRAGWPTDEELERHREVNAWLAKDEHGALLTGYFSTDEEDGLPVFVDTNGDLWTRQFVEENGWSFWPCDQHGNKVRRGARWTRRN